MDLKINLVTPSALKFTKQTTTDDPNNGVFEFVNTNVPIKPFQRKWQVKSSEERKVSSLYEQVNTVREMTMTSSIIPGQALNTSISLKVTLSIVHQKTIKTVQSIKIEGKFLDNLRKSLEGTNAHLHATITIYEKRLSQNTCSQWTTEETNLGAQQNGSSSISLNVSQISFHILPSTVATIRDQSEPTVLECNLTIYVTPFSLTKKGYDNTELATITRNILQDASTSDTVIVATNGTEVPCHKSFLSAQSPVLKAMLQSGFKEGLTNKIEMSDMSEGGIRAFLSYLYSLDFSHTEVTPQVGLELLRAGDKYDIPNLVTHMKSFLLAKEATWYTVDTALDIYLLALALNGGSLGGDLKEKMLDVLTEKNEELSDCPKFHEMFEVNPAAAKDLSLLSLSVMRKRARLSK